MNTLLKKAFESISFEGEGEYGLHNGFFNATCTINGATYNFQGCADNGEFDASSCGHDDGICGDVNLELAEVLANGEDLAEGYDMLKKLLEEAYKKYAN